MQAGNTISYYTIITKRADFYDAHGKNKLAQGLASELKGGYSTSSGKHFGPIVIPLGPPAAVKKNESATGMTAAGGTTVSISKAEEGAADMITNGFAATDLANVLAVYGLDEQDLKEAVVNVILSKSPDPFKLAGFINRWKVDLYNYVASKGKSQKPPAFW